MTTTQTIRLSDPAELVALLPSQLGYTPFESIVLVSLRPPGSQVGMMMRVDLTELVGHNGSLAAAGITRVLLDDNASAVLIAIYGSPRFTRPELNRLVQLLSGQFRQAELPYSVWSAADGAIKRLEISPARPTRDRPITKRTPSQPPAGGKPNNSKANQELTGMVHRSRAGVVRQAPTPSPSPTLLPTVSAIDKRSARRATRRALDTRLNCGMADLADWRLVGVNLFLRAVAAHQVATPPSMPALVPPTDLGRLAALLADPVGRDSLIVAAIGASPDWARDMARGGWHESGDLPEKVNQLLNPLTAPDAPADQVTASETVLRLVAAHASAQRRPAALDLLAWLAWWRGDAVQAQEYLAAAEVGSNEPPLGDLVRAALAAGLMPPSRSLL